MTENIPNAAETMSPREAFAGLLKSVGQSIETWSNQEAVVFGRNITHKEARSVIGAEAAIGTALVAALGPNPEMTYGQLHDLLDNITNGTALWTVQPQPEYYSAIVTNNPAHKAEVMQSNPNLYTDAIPNLRHCIDSIVNNMDVNGFGPVSLKPEGMELLAQIDNTLRQSEITKAGGMIIEGLAAASMAASSAIGEFKKTNNQNVRNSSIGPHIGRFFKWIGDAVEGSQNSTHQQTEQPQPNETVPLS